MPTFAGFDSYAYPGDGRGVVRVGCSATETGGVVITIRDSGGPPKAVHANAASSGGLGVSLMRAHAQAMNAEIIFDPQPEGMCVQLTIPPAA